MLKANPKKIWNVINRPENSKISLCDGDGAFFSDHACAGVLSITFSDAFSSPSNIAFPQLSEPQYAPMDPISIDTMGICKLIETLPLSSSAGNDMINSKLLKSTITYSSIYLTKIFEQSLVRGQLPVDWKVGKIIPVHKSGDKHSSSNYRPISLTSVPCKILEHIIYSHLVQHLEFNSFFHQAQHGFRKSFSCETQLASFTHDLQSVLDRCSVVDCIFIDFAKAFDKVSHILLLHKLSFLNIDSQVLTWIHSFLLDRYQYVTANDANSELSPVRSGVPQGSVLGPLLFLIYINDLPNSVRSSLRLFADDCVLYREVSNTTDIDALQSDLNSLLDWCRTWRMELNITKCKHLRVSRKNTSCPVYKLNNDPLESVTSYKYLGVHISSNLSWRKHIEHVINNANRTLGYIKRNFFLAPFDLKLTLYKSLVRSKLEYAASIWDPHEESLIHAIESVQNRSARFILSNYHRTASVTSMKASLHIPHLSLRRKISRLCLFHKIYYHNPSLKISLILPPYYISPRTDHRQKVGIHQSSTSAFAHSFMPKASLEWNQLPPSVTSITSITAFKKAVSDHFLVVH